MLSFHVKYTSDTFTEFLSGYTGIISLQDETVLKLVFNPFGKLLGYLPTTCA